MAESKVTARMCDSCQRPLTPKSDGKIIGRVCAGCRVRKCRGTELEGSCFCGHADRRVLRWHEFLDQRAVVCANHSAIAGRRPLTYEELQAECASDVKG